MKDLRDLQNRRGGGGGGPPPGEAEGDALGVVDQPCRCLVHLPPFSGQKSRLVGCQEGACLKVSRFNYFTGRSSCSEAGSYLRRIDSCTTQLKARGVVDQPCRCFVHLLPRSYLRFRAHI
jgi:hypothetical protein